MKLKKPEILSKFNDLTVINTNSSKGPYHVVCQCSCGSITDVSMYHLLSGNTKSCRCQKSKIQNNGQGAVSLKDLYSTYKRNARNRNLKFSLSIEEFSLLTHDNCHYCGSEPRPYNKYLTKDGQQKRKGKKYKDSTIKLAEIMVNGIDRKDNGRGYEISNCLTCCVICNRAKNNMTYEEFIKWIDGVKKN
ncbi:MAG: hypothetical protein HC840_01030 [Leptolyngbyaceae cyanobacterium RM2_2_4]|nr:hypothetical protein [Leptolyngbyaceae cyanobacterium RM2_2_4]